MTFIERSAMLKRSPDICWSRRQSCTPSPPKPAPPAPIAGWISKGHWHPFHLRRSRQPRAAGRYPVAGR
jgi:hypothetical protein